MWCPDGQSSGLIYRLEPDGIGGFNRFYETKISLLVENYLPGSSVNYALGAYNEFYKYIDPITLDTLHLVGFEANISGGSYPLWNAYYKGALFAKRDAAMQYNIEEINGPVGINDPALVATRCYVKSPFTNEEALYFGGFDPNSNTATNMSWIYKKSYLTNSTNEEIIGKNNINIYPNPAINQLNIEININEITQGHGAHINETTPKGTEHTSTKQPKVTEHTSICPLWSLSLEVDPGIRTSGQQLQNCSKPYPELVLEAF